MKKSLFLSLVLLLTLPSKAQDISGPWYGILKVQGLQLRLAFHLTKTDTGYTATMDSPDQGVRGIPVTTVNYRDSTLEIRIDHAKILYEAKLNKDNIFKGTFNQSVMKLPLDLSRQKPEKQGPERPQEPKPPFPYYTEEVAFVNERDSITLAGTLSMPAKGGRYPAVILISGSGPQNRDEEISGHKPFLVIADHLTKNGIAVLRFDDRGTGKSTGNHGIATTKDFATDVESALNYLNTRKEIDGKKIGLIGHSEGGLIAPMVAKATDNTHFIVLLAAPGLRGDKLLLLQQKAIGNAMGTSEKQLKTFEKINKKIFEMVVSSKDTALLKISLTTSIKNALDSMPADSRPPDTEIYAAQQAKQLTNSWMVGFLKYDPIPALEKVSCPVLALNGGKDLQVPPDPNISLIRAALERGGNKNITTKVLPGLNHLFQECDKGLPGEYSTIRQTFSPVALNEMTEWILKQVR